MYDVVAALEPIGDAEPRRGSCTRGRASPGTVPVPRHDRRRREAFIEALARDTLADVLARGALQR